tara:strand:+ start:2854 stop:3102 length:249 start_codon:yes stop_codon:yes gene_type:complete
MDLQPLRLVKLSDVPSVQHPKVWEIDENYIQTTLGGYEYAIPLKDTDTREKVLNWVAHLSAKKWMTTEGLKQFASLLMRERK